jgi:hypothetical protein
VRQRSILCKDMLHGRSYHLSRTDELEARVTAGDC